MKWIKWILACAVLVVLIVYFPVSYVRAWAGSNAVALISYPLYTSSDQDIAIPFSVMGRLFNTNTDVDNYEIWLIADENDDEVISAGEYADAEVLITVEDYNVNTEARLTPRNFIKSYNVTDGEHYFLYIRGKDIGGGFSSTSTDLIGSGTAGNATVREESIVYFTAQDQRP